MPKGNLANPESQNLFVSRQKIVYKAFVKPVDSCCSTVWWTALFTAPTIFSWFSVYFMAVAFEPLLCDGVLCLHWIAVELSVRTQWVITFCLHCTLCLNSDGLLLFAFHICEPCISCLFQIRGVSRALRPSPACFKLVQLARWERSSSSKLASWEAGFSFHSTKLSVAESGLSSDSDSSSYFKALQPGFPCWQLQMYLEQVNNIYKRDMVLWNRFKLNLSLIVSDDQNPWHFWYSFDLTW